MEEDFEIEGNESCLYFEEELTEDNGLRILIEGLELYPTAFKIDQKRTSELITFLGRKLEEMKAKTNAFNNTDTENSNEFWVECNVCKQHLKNCIGSTPCCGAIAHVIENGEKTNKVILLGGTGEGPLEPIQIDFLGR